MIILATCTMLVGIVGASDSITQTVDPLFAGANRFWELVLRRNRDLQMDSISRLQAISDWTAQQEMLYPSLKPVASISTVNGPGSTKTDKAAATISVAQWVPGGGAISVTPAWNWSRSEYGSPWPVSRQDTSLLSFSWTQNFLRYAWKGDTSLAQLKLARYKARIADLETRARIRGLRKETIKAWWNSAAQAVSILIAKADSAICGDLLELSRKRLFGGVGSVIDTLQAKAELDRAYANMTEARISWAYSIEKLRNLADTDWNVSPESMGIILRRDSSSEWPLEPLLPPKQVWPLENEWLSFVESNAPELQLALANEERAAIQRKNQWWDRLPTLQGTATAGTPIVDRFGRNWQWGGQLVITWDIPNSIARANYRVALLEVRKLGVARFQARRLLRQEYQRILAEAKWTENRLLARILSAQSMRDRREALMTMYLEGPGRLNDALQAQRDWGTSLSSAWMALTSYGVAIDELRN